MVCPIWQPPKVELGGFVWWFFHMFSSSVFGILLLMCPPNSSKIGSQSEIIEKKKVGAHFLTHNTSGVGGHVRALGWD